jgi:PEP-CTERM motif
MMSGFAVSHLAAGTVSAQFTSANGQQDSSGNYISPYTATINGVSTTIYCDDFANHVSNGEQWTANLTNLASGNLSNTRYSAISNTLSTSATTSATYNGTQLYDMAAWLTTQFSPIGSAGYASNGDIQDTLWDLFNPNAVNTGVNPPKPSSNTYLYAAEKNYSGINAASFQILTNTSVAYNGEGQVQEFIVATPEPSTVLLLGFGLVALAIAGKKTLLRSKV